MSDDIETLSAAIADSVIVDACEKHVKVALAHSLFTALGFHLVKSPGHVVRPNWKERDRFLAPYDKRMKSILRSLWREEKRAVLANMRRTPVLSLPSRGISCKSDLSDIDQWLYQESKYVDTLADKVASGLTPLVRAAILRAVTEHDLDIAFDVVNRRALNWLHAYAPKLSWHVEQETLATLRSQLSAGIAAGENMDKLRKRVSETFGDMEKWRAERIARSETIRAQEQGNLAAWKEGGFSQKVWLANPDCCDICQDLDGKVVDIDEPFFDDHYGDGMAPPAHPNCRCSASGWAEGW
jgi:SPP1 gp7 family putative phage head morphogenesis protein